MWYRNRNRIFSYDSLWKSINKWKNTLYYFVYFYVVFIVAIPPNIDNIAPTELISENILPRPLAQNIVITPKPKSNEENVNVNESVNNNSNSSNEGVNEDEKIPTIPINDIDDGNDDQNIAKTPGPTEENDNAPTQWLRCFFIMFIVIFENNIKKINIKTDNILSEWWNRCPNI